VFFSINVGHIQTEILFGIFDHFSIRMIIAENSTEMGSHYGRFTSPLADDTLSGMLTINAEIIIVCRSYYQSYHIFIGLPTYIFDILLINF